MLGLQFPSECQPSVCVCLDHVLITAVGSVTQKDS